MKKNTNLAALRLIKKFDEQLHQILSAELQAVKSGKVKMMNRGSQELLIA